MMRRSIVLERAGVLLVPPILVVAVYLLFVGHNAPGGGFVGGLTAGLAIALASAAEGSNGIRRTTRVAPTTLLGVGLALAGITGGAGWILGAGFLDAGALTADLPVLGEIKLTSALAFDVGVFCVVSGMVAMVLEALNGAEEPA